MPAGSLFDLSGRVALVTGASRGIGSAIARTLAEHGAQVVLSSRKQADLDAEAERINTQYAERATPIAAHAGRPEDLERLVQQVMERFSRIDILVNNAGTNPYFGPVMGAELAAWDKTFEVNLRGVFVLTRLVYQASMEAHGGAIVNISSHRFRVIPTDSPVTSARLRMSSSRRPSTSAAASRYLVASPAARI